MLLDFLKNKHLNSATELKTPTDGRSAPISDKAYTESPDDVITVCDLSHMTHEQRQEFRKNAVYSKTKPVRDSQ